MLKLQEVANTKSESEKGDASLKQDLVRATLARQTLELEKKELLMRIDELESAMTKSKPINGNGRLQLEEFIKKQQRQHQSDASCHGSLDPAELKALYDEELSVAKDAISNLRTSFG